MNKNHIYEVDVYQKENKTEIIRINVLNNSTLEIVTESSVFFPVGGGQPSDIGTISKNGTDFDVIHAFLDGEHIVHVVDAKPDEFSLFDKVTLSINWDFRFQNMQRHLGEHILTGSFYNLYGFENRGFHMGEEYMTIDLFHDSKTLTDEMVDTAELLANKILWENYPVNSYWFADKEVAANSINTRKKITQDGEIKVTVVGTLSNPFDSVPCCGTHPKNTGEVGMIKIYKFHKNKDMTRIFFDAGSMAFSNCVLNRKILNKISNKMSTSIEDLERCLDVINKKQKSLKAENLKIRNELCNMEESKIINFINSNMNKNIFCFTANENISNITKFGFNIIEKSEIKILLLLIEQGSLNVHLFSSCSDKFNCKDFISNATKEFRCKGGGTPYSGRISFYARCELTDFIKSIT